MSLGSYILNEIKKQGTAGAKKLLNQIQYGVKPARQFVERAQDPITDPQTYKRLAVDAERVLGRPLPPQFSGAKFGNIPARATGLVSDLTEKTNRQRAVEAGMVNRVIREMAGEVPNRPPITAQTAGGALRAPGVGRTVTRQDPRLIPESAPTGDPYARDYGLTRQLMQREGGGSMMGVAERLAADALPSTRVPTPPPHLLLPSTVTPADIQRAERKLADRLAQGEISVSSEDAAALFNRLRGQAPPARDIPASVPEYLQGTFLRPGPGEVKGFGMPLRYPAGTQAVGGRKLGNTTYGEGVEANIGAFLGPVPPPNKLSLEDVMGQERLARQMEFEQGIPISRPGEIRGRSFFSEPDPFTGRIEIDPRINPYPTSQVVLDTAGNVVEDISPLAAIPPASYSPNSLMGPFPVGKVVDPVTKATRNATGGIQMGDLNTLIDVLRNNPIRSVGALGGAGLTGFGLSSVIGNMMRGDEGSAPLDPQGGTRTVPGEPLVTPNGINQPEQLPVLFADNDGTPLGSVGSPEQSQPMPRRSDPTAPAPVITRGDNDGARRQQLAQYSPSAAAIDRAMEPSSPERYKSAEDYYAARAAYANQAPVRQSLMKYAEGTGSSPAESTALRTWAQSYPALAYEMQRRSMVNHEANQQTQQSVTTRDFTTSMGTNNQANAIENAKATAQSAVDPTQGSFDLRSATTPMEQPVLTPAEEFLQRLSVPQRDQMMYY
jgi:hypothetical protein